jgi:two-component system, sensor histidine kinase and response regulator
VKIISIPEVLVVEDDEDMNELICNILTSAGYHTTAAHDGDAGLKKARELVPDLILLDVKMPKLDGVEMCRILQNEEKTKGIPVIIVTAKSDLSTKVQSYVSGARRYITKPFDMNRILSEVERVLCQQKMSEDMLERDERNIQ